MLANSYFRVAPYLPSKNLFLIKLLNAVNENSVKEAASTDWLIETGGIERSEASLQFILDDLYSLLSFYSLPSPLCQNKHPITNR